MSNIQVYSTPDEVATAAAEAFVVITRVAVAQRGICHLTLSGGSTPQAMHQLLVTEPFKSKVPWERLVIFWGDERCVPPDDDESNYKMTDLALLSHIDIPASNIHRVLGEDPPTNEALRYAKVIEENVSSANVFPQFDWIFLGMGDDGHTASLFPGASNLKEMEKIIPNGTIGTNTL